MTPLGIGSIVEGVGKIADDLFTSDEERAKIDLEYARIDADLLKSQIEVNKTEASHQSIFIAGWRPTIGWVGALAIAYQFIIYPLLTWVVVLVDAGINPPELGDTDALYPIIWVCWVSVGCAATTSRRAQKLRGLNKMKGTINVELSGETLDEPSWLNAGPLRLPPGIEVQGDLVVIGEDEEYLHCSVTSTGGYYWVYKSDDENHLYQYLLKLNT